MRRWRAPSPEPLIALAVMATTSFHRGIALFNAALFAPQILLDLPARQSPARR